jgi:hypothetical protein
MSKKMRGLVRGATLVLLGGGVLRLWWGSIVSWPEHAFSIQLTCYSIAVVGLLLDRALQYRRHKRFWWALGVPIVCHGFFLYKIEKLFPFKDFTGLYLVLGEYLILVVVMVLIFGVSKTNPLVPDASLPETVKQNENGAS